MKPIFTYKLPEELVFENPGGDERHFPDEAVLLALANLARLGLITGTMVLDGSVIYDKILPRDRKSVV